jgi:hypothetical protein
MPPEFKWFIHSYRSLKTSQTWTTPDQILIDGEIIL